MYSVNLVEVHPGDTGRKRDERADGGQHPPHEHRELPVLLEPGFGAVEVLLLDPDVTAVADPDLPSALEPYKVGDPGPRDVPGDPGGWGRQKAHPAGRDQIAGKRLYGLARDQDSRALQRHEPKDRKDPVAADGTRDPIYERL